jgi:hypothetical protein
MIDGSEARRSYPLGAFVIGAAGAVLIVLEGVYIMTIGVSLAGNDLIPTGLLVTSFEQLGVLTVIGGALALGLMLLVYARPNTHTFVGVGTISLGVLSLFSGGGFLLGAFLLWAGGVMAVYRGLRSGPGP